MIVCVMANYYSQGAIHLVENLTFSLRTKHTEARESFLVILNEELVIRLEKINTKENAADVFTNTLLVAKFEHCSNLIVDLFIKVLVPHSDIMGKSEAV